MVGEFYHVKVMFYYDYGISRVTKPLQDFEELLYVGEVQARRRLVEYVDGLSRRPLRELP